jgi:hypothetical protein
VIRRMIDKWLAAGVLEDGHLHRPTEGTPQGGVISPPASALVPCVIDFVVDLRIDCSAMTEMSRDRETCCRKEVCREAQR